MQNKNTNETVYKQELMKEMINLGASEQEIALIKKETILNSIKANRKPKDVAWALLQ